ncbi:hypothetical protein NIES4071_79770 [Calothrix sp. NIES-4071]|nr:hypothetical protein NIES4071_79770 [Calothrix sp. NIES-4071]BAZ62247.1 hypothetical protein NIES4105_79700 [Calothrix sp. NIES-4105]
MVFLHDEQSTNIVWGAYPVDDSSDPYDWVLDSIMAASPIDQPAPIDIVVEPVAQSADD